MDKYTAFNLYRSGWTTQGAAVAIPLEPDGERHEVYLAADVAELERQLAFANDAAAKGEKARTEAAGMQERIAELEKALRTYGGHKEICSILRSVPCSETNPCDCGFSALMESGRNERCN